MQISRALRRMLCCLGTKVNPHMCRSVGYVWTGKFDLNTDTMYVRTWKFVNSERKSCGFKSIRIRVDGAGVIIFLGKLALIKKSSSSKKCFKW